MPSIFVPAKRRIDGPRELSTTSFVDTTGVDPNILQATSQGLVAGESDFLCILS
jgi:hypothetical protein